MNRILAILLLAVAFTVSNYGQGYPGRPVKIVRSGEASILYFDNPESISARAIFHVISKRRQLFKKDLLIAYLSFGNRGNQLLKPSAISIGLTFTEFRRDCKNAGDTHLTILKDSNPLLSADLPLIGFDKDKDRNYCNEKFMFSLSYEQFTQLVAPEKVRINIGSSEFELKKSTFKIFQDLKRTVEP